MPRRGERELRQELRGLEELVKIPADWRKFHPSFPYPHLPHPENPMSFEKLYSPHLWRPFRPDFPSFQVPRLKELGEFGEYNDDLANWSTFCPSFPGQNAKIRNEEV
jgi:hypothetical protein